MKSIGLFLMTVLLAGTASAGNLNSDVLGTKVCLDIGSIQVAKFFDTLHITVIQGGGKTVKSEPVLSMGRGDFKTLRGLEDFGGLQVTLVDSYAIKTASNSFLIAEDANGVTYLFDVKHETYIGSSLSCR